jgi:hypothetical protein
VPRPLRKVLPKRTPLALRKRKARAVMTAVFPSAANHVFPGPSGPDGHRILLMLLKPASELEASPSTSAPVNGTGTRDEENGVAPDEKGTFGLFVLLVETEPFPEKEVTKEPAKRRLEPDELVVMASTSASPPDRPPNGGADHDDVFGSQTATASAGEVNLPPVQTLLFAESQYNAETTPFGPPDPRAEKEDEEGVYDAMLAAVVPPNEEKLPAK